MLIVKSDPLWTDKFKQIKSIISESFSKTHITIEHVGSTAISQLAAKSIIDIDIIYYREEDFDKIQRGLSSLGYYHNGDQGIAGREVFKRVKDFDHPTLDTIKHHLYVCAHDNEELKRHILFRNYLISNPEARAQYEKLKLQLAIEANQDKEAYALSKQERARTFIEEIIRKATES